MTTRAEQCYHPDKRYKAIQAYPIKAAQRLSLEEVMGIIEEFHDPLWRMCGLTPAGPVLWIFYERVIVQ